MKSNEWLSVMQQAEDYNPQLTPLIIKYGEFQQETDFGCITGIWVTQYSVGMEGDSYAGTIWVKLKDYKYLEMPFSC